MAYIALYRNYRPNSFSEVAGQKHIIKTLKNAVVNQKTSHAYVFSGQRGIGKTTIARILAKAVNCLDPINGEPCNKCSNCLSIQNNETPDIVEIDAASNNGVDEMRSLLEKVNYLPGSLNKKVYIIDEAHMLSISAFNALLKTLEEPPLHVMFVLATTEPHKIPSTILSRCQRFDFLQLNNSEIVDRLEKICIEEDIMASDNALLAIAEAAEGGMRDAVNILDQVNSFSDGEITLEDIDSVTGRVSDYKLIELINSFVDKDAATCLKIVDDLLEMGKEISRLTSNLIQFLRDILLFKNKVENNNVRNIYNSKEFIDLTNKINSQLIFYYIDVLMDANNKIKYSNSSKIYLEVAIMKIVSTSLDDLLNEKVTNSNNEKVVLQSNMANQELEIKISELELRVQKIIEQLDGLKLFEFKETTLGKLALLEDVASVNSTLPQEFEEKIHSIETQIASLNISNSVENVSSTSVNDEFVSRLEALENKEVPSVDLSKYDGLFDEIKSLKEKEVVSTAVTNSFDNAKIKELEENIDQLMSYIIDFESKQLTNEMDKYSQELSELKENYLVLVNKIVSGTSNGIEFDIDELKETILKEIPVQDYSNEFASINEKIESIDLKSNNVNLEINNLLEKISEFDLKIQNVSSKLDTIGTNNFDEKVNDIYKYINDVKEYNLRLNIKVTELQKSVESLKEAKTEIQPVVKAVETPKVEVLPVKEEVLVKEEEVVKETPVVKEEIKPIIKEEKVSTLSDVKEVDETSKIFDVAIIEKLLHDSRTETSRQAKIDIASGWARLANTSNNTTAPIAKLLRDGMFVAYGNNTILLVYSLATYCNRLMTPKVHKEARDILRITFGQEYDFIAIPEQTWQEKRKEYHSQYGIGIRFPKLTPIKNPELKVIVVKDESEMKDRTYEKATSIFGFKNVRRED